MGSDYTYNYHVVIGEAFRPTIIISKNVATRRVVHSRYEQSVDFRFNIGYVSYTVKCSAYASSILRFILACDPLKINGVEISRYVFARDSPNVRENVLINAAAHLDQVSTTGSVKRSTSITPARRMSALAHLCGWSIVIERVGMLPSRFSRPRKASERRYDAASPGDRSALADDTSGVNRQLRRRLRLATNDARRTLYAVGVASVRVAVAWGWCPLMADLIAA